jgi:NADPH-dependent ferric siderophore reductase
VTALRKRREPPPFLRVEVVASSDMTPRLRRITLAGDGLAAYADTAPAASVRLLLPRPGRADIEVPTWNGNEFLDAQGERPLLRTLTPLAFDADRRALDVAVVRHGPGALSTWAGRAEPGHRAAVSGPGRGYEPDATAGGFVLAGDETALPAVITLLGALPAEAPVTVLVEIADPAARLDLPARLGLTVTWLDLPPGAPSGAALVDAVQAMSVDAGTRLWAAGEAAAMQRLRRHLFDERGMARAHTSIRGYWKHGRAGESPPA